MSQQRDFAEMLFDSNKSTIFEAVYKRKFRKLIRTGMSNLKRHHRKEQIRRAKCLSKDEFTLIAEEISEDSDTSLTDEQLSASSNSAIVEISDSKKSIAKLDIMSTHNKNQESVSITSVNKDTNRSKYANDEGTALLVPSFNKRQRLSSFNSFINENKTHRKAKSSTRRKKLVKQPTQRKIEVTRMKVPILFQNSARKLLNDASSSHSQDSQTNRIHVFDESEIDDFNGKLAPHHHPRHTSRPMSSNFVMKSKKKIHNKFYYKNCLVMDKGFGNAIFEIFEPAYDYDISSTDSSESTSQHGSGSDSLDHSNFQEHMNVVHSQSSSKEEVKETVGELNEGINQQHLKSLLGDSKKNIRMRKKMSAKNQFRARLFGDKSLQNMMTNAGDQAKRSNKDKSDANERSKRIKYKIADDPEMLFNNDSGSLKSESLKSITSQYDDNSEEASAKFEYLAERAIFTPSNSSHKKPHIARKKQSSILNIFKNAAAGTTKNLFNIDP